MDINNAFEEAFEKRVRASFDEAVDKAYLETTKNMGREERAFYFLGQVLASNYR